MTALMHCDCFAYFVEAAAQDQMRAQADRAAQMQAEDMEAWMSEQTGAIKLLRAGMAPNLPVKAPTSVKQQPEGNIAPFRRSRACRKLLQGGSSAATAVTLLFFSSAVLLSCLAITVLEIFQDLVNYEAVDLTQPRSSLACWASVPKVDSFMSTISQSALLPPIDERLVAALQRVPRCSSVFGGGPGNHVACWPSFCCEVLATSWKNNRKICGRPWNGATTDVRWRKSQRRS